MRNDPAKALIGLAVFVLIGTAILGTNTFWLLIVGTVVLGGVIAYFSTSKCPSCEARGTLTHLHQRVDGGQDRRFSYNPVVCRKCDWPRTAKKSAPLELGQE